AYPFSGTLGTFIVECDEATWRKAGLESATEAESIAYCERLFADDLGGARLLSNNSKWISFATLKCGRWHDGNLALLGDAAHTAHFSIGSGTKLAMDDAIALANAIESYPDLERALTEYELARRPIVEIFQAAAVESQAYFEHVSRYTTLPTAQFTFNLLTRSKRITYDDLRLRDPKYCAWVDAEFAASPGFAPPPAFTPLALGDLSLASRIAVRVSGRDVAEDCASAGAALLVSEPLAIAAEGRVDPQSGGLYTPAQAEAWTRRAEAAHATGARLAITLGHAGRRGATQPPRAGASMPDRPLPAAEVWPLVAPSAIPYTARSQTPHALTAEGMATIREAFVAVARLADAAGADLLLLDMARGHLLASFLSPLANQRDDEWGGSLERRMRFPLEVFAAVRKAWPAGKPLGVALT
ncbi:MAG: FAD-dependent monooxygenase, partial [Chloroflexota bacterium]|nr:FAD-dependent monooxygenase [Chloroflexota bacterium]